MTLNQAFSIRVKQILEEKKMTQYKLEQLTGIYHSTMTSILTGKTKGSYFSTMATIISVLGLSLSEFFDHEVFNFENLEID